MFGHIRPIIVYVAQEHIDKGVKGCLTGCPVYWGAKAVVKEDVTVHVGMLTIAFGNDTEWIIFNLPQTVQQMLYDYDYNGYVMQPFGFELEIPRKWLRR